MLLTGWVWQGERSIREGRVVRLAVADARPLGIGRDGDRRLGHALVVVQHHLPIWVVEGVVVAEEGITARERGVVLDGEVMLVEVIEVECVGVGQR